VAPVAIANPDATREDRLGHSSPGKGPEFFPTVAPRFAHQGHPGCIPNAPCSITMRAVFNVEELQGPPAWSHGASLPFHPDNLLRRSPHGQICRLQGIADIRAKARAARSATRSVLNCGDAARRSVLNNLTSTRSCRKLQKTAPTCSRIVDGLSRARCPRWFPSRTGSTTISRSSFPHAVRLARRKSGCHPLPLTCRLSTALDAVIALDPSSARTPRPARDDS